MKKDDYAPFYDTLFKEKPDAKREQIGSNFDPKKQSLSYQNVCKNRSEASEVASSAFVSEPEKNFPGKLFPPKF